MDTLHEVLLHAEKIGVLYAVSHTRDVGPLFFESTVDGAVYGDIQQQFMALLELGERDCWFQLDGATCHTANETINLLRDFFW